MTRRELSTAEQLLVEDLDVGLEAMDEGRFDLDLEPYPDSSLY